MQLDSENFLESSNNPNVIGNRYCMRSRKRKIYDDRDFKEVVKNFYILITDINKIAAKKIQKNPQQKYKQQSNVQTKKQLQKKMQSQDLRKNDLYNFKKEPIYSQLAFQQQQQYFETMNNPYIRPMNTQKAFTDLISQQTMPRNQMYGGQLKRNSYHIGIAYFIFLNGQGQGQFEMIDPTMNAKKKMKETNYDVLKQLDNFGTNFNQVEQLQNAIQRNEIEEEREGNQEKANNLN